MKKTIGFKMTVLFALFALVLGLAVSTFAYLAAWNSYTDIYHNKALVTARTVAAFLDGDHLATYEQTGQKDAEYAQLQETLNLFKRELGVEYLFVFVPGADSFTYLAEAQLETDEPQFIASPGDVEPYTSIQYEYLLPDVEARRSSSQKVVTNNEDGYGRVVSAWAPVFSGTGEMVVMVQADVSMEDVESELTAFMSTMVAIFVGVALVLVLALLLLMRRMIARPLAALTKNALDFASGAELAPVASTLKTGDEMQVLSEAFAKMGSNIHTYTQNLAAVTADRERIATELDVATRIQASLLPCIFPPYPDRTEFDLYATMQPAREVGGDFYDFFFIDENTLAVVVADVSGKGVPAALFMVIAKTLIKNNAQSNKSPSEVFSAVNNLLCENNDADMFVTAFLGYFDIPSGRFTFVNAGHNPPFLMSGKNAPERLVGKKSFVLAGRENMPYRQSEIILHPGDELFLYTDGVTEAMNRAGALFGEARLVDLLAARRGSDGEALLPAIKQAIDEFADGAEQADDITMLSLTYSGLQQGQETVLQAEQGPAGEATRVAQTSAPLTMHEIRVVADVKNVSTVQEFVSAHLEGVATKARNKVGIIVDEIFANIASYTYGSSSGEVCVRVAVEDEIYLEFEDSGTAWNPLTAVAPDVTTALEEREIGGLGILMVKKLARSVAYRRESEKNILTVRV